MMDCMARANETATPHGRAGMQLMPSLDARSKALASASLYRMLARAFSAPEPELARFVIKECSGLRIALRRGALSAWIAHSLKAVEREWRDVISAELQDEYSRLFLGAGLVPLREGGFGGGLRFAGQPVDIADVSGFYLAFGFVLPDSAASPPDFLGAELEFMSLLHLKLALAFQRRKMEHVRVTRTAMAHFLKDHLGRWAEPLAAALADASALPAYRTMGRLLVRAVETDCLRLKIRPSKARAGAGRDPVCGEELACPFSRQSGYDAGFRRDALEH
jgi:TorA maturation chaperone TorD